jgi:predicted SAM-dependent methyltransferase
MNLHIGGRERKDGWKILDAQSGPEVDYVADIRNLSQFGDDSIESVYASHVLEHVGQADIVPVLRGIRRTLKQGGEFRVAVPDLDVLCHLLLNPRASVQMKWQTMQMMFGGQIDPHDFHYVGLNEHFLGHFLGEVGFREVRRVASFGLFQDSSELRLFGVPISLNMIAVK